MFEVISISIAVLGGALVLRLLPGLLSGNERLLGNIKTVLLVLYILVILYATLLSRSITYHVHYKLSLLWSYRASLSFFDDGNGIGLYIKDSALLKQIILNVLLYIPFGYLLPYAGTRLVKPHRAVPRRVTRMLQSSPWAAVLIGVALSVVIELAQLVFRLGLFELDDILNNTIGCALGVILYQLLLRPRVKKQDRA